MEFFALQTDLSGHDFETAFRIAREEIGGPNGLFFWNGKPFTTLYETEQTELTNLGLLPDYQAAVANALSQIDGDLIAEAGQSGLLPDPPVISDEAFPPVAPFAASPLAENDVDVTSEIAGGGEDGTLWEAFKDLGQAVWEIFSPSEE